MIFKVSDLLSTATHLQKGNIVLFPCDTIWGILGIATPEVAQKIRELKGRSIDHPFIVLVSEQAQAEHLIAPHTLTDQQRHYINTVWPGPTTLIFKKSEALSNIITGNRPTIGIRIPDFWPLYWLLQLVKQPIISTSANPSGQNTPTSLSEIDPHILAGVHACFHAFEPFYKHPSQIIDLTQDPPQMLRTGNHIDRKGN